MHIPILNTLISDYFKTRCSVPTCQLKKRGPVFCSFHRDVVNKTARKKSAQELIQPGFEKDRRRNANTVILKNVKGFYDKRYCN